MFQFHLRSMYNTYTISCIDSRVNTIWKKYAIKMYYIFFIIF